jgi:hypothetical protein
MNVLQSITFGLITFSHFNSGLDINEIAIQLKNQQNSSYKIGTDL